MARHPVAEGPGATVCQTLQEEESNVARASTVWQFAPYCRAEDSKFSCRSFANPLAVEKPPVTYKAP